MVVCSFVVCVIVDVLYVHNMRTSVCVVVSTAVTLRIKDNLVMTFNSGDLYFV